MIDLFQETVLLIGDQDNVISTPSIKTIENQFLL